MLCAPVCVSIRLNRDRCVGVSKCVGLWKCKREREREREREVKVKKHSAHVFCSTAAMNPSLELLISHQEMVRLFYAQAALQRTLKDLTSIKTRILLAVITSTEQAKISLTPNQLHLTYSVNSAKRSSSLVVRVVATGVRDYPIYFRQGFFRYKVAWNKLRTRRSLNVWCQGIKVVLHFPFYPCSSCQTFLASHFRTSWLSRLRLGSQVCSTTDYLCLLPTQHS